MANTSVIVIPEGKICDYVDGKFRNDTPEEYVRQTIEKRLVNEHKYLPKQIRIEYTLQLGSRKPRADIVIFDKDCGEQTQENIKIIIECKKEAVEARNAKDGVEQLKSYMSACPNCEWGINCKRSSDAGFVYAYLKSKVGNRILLTNSYGAVITHIEPEHLATVPIPDAPDTLKLKIGNLVIRSYALRDESNNLIDEATKLLIDELHLPAIDDFSVNYFKKDASVDTFNVKLSDMGYRLDASYHVPLVDAIVDHLSKYAAEVTSVGDRRISNAVILPGRFKRVYADEVHGYVLFGGKQIHTLDPSGDKYLSKSKHDARISKELLIDENTTLITRSGTVGKVALVPKHWSNWIASEHIIRVIPASQNIAGYNYIFLRSDYGRVLIQRYTYGAVVDEIDDSHVRNIPIPLLKNHDIQKRINALALEANQKRYEAYKLEQKALEIMDKEVIYAK